MGTNNYMFVPPIPAPKVPNEISSHYNFNQADALNFNLKMRANNNNNMIEKYEIDDLGRLPLEDHFNLLPIPVIYKTSDPEWSEPDGQDWSGYNLY